MEARVGYLEEGEEGAGSLLGLEVVGGLELGELGEEEVVQAQHRVPVLLTLRLLPTDTSCIPLWSLVLTS